MAEYGAPLSLICREVIRPALQQAGIWSEAREQLVLGTGAVESRFKYVKQLGDGPAMGWFQCEPATHQDLWANFIPGRPQLKDRLRLLCEGLERNGALVAFPQYAAAICGVHYLRIKAALPAAGDAQAMAEYHKRYYNTALGKTDPAESVIHFQRAIEACQ
jgi:hypothetical protein